MKSYSRLAQVEEKRNIKKAVLYILLLLVGFVFVIFLGLPTLIRFAGFVGELGKSDRTIEVSDITPPAPPQFDQIPEYTNKESLSIEGTSESGATITITANNNSSDVIAGSDGKFNFIFNLDKGENSISAVAKDTAGNKSTETKVYKIVFDNEEPEINISSPKDGDSFYGSGQRQLTIKGSVSENVSLYINDRFIPLKEDNSFVFSTTLSEGENKFEIKAKDPSQNETSTSLTVNFNP